MFHLEGLLPLILLFFPQQNLCIPLVTLTLNNQVIRLLSDLGNSDGQFIAFQNQGFRYSQTPEEQQPSAIDIAVQKNMSYSLS